MKDALIAILVLIVLVLGYFFIKEKNQDDNRNPWPETVPARPTNNQSTQNNQTPTQTNNSNQSNSTSTNTQSTGGNSSSGFTTINVPLVNNNSIGQFGPFGCGAYISFIPRQVPETSAVLNATYNWLFSNPSSFDGGNFHNVIATQTNLDFQNAEIINGTAKVYLTGSIMANHCADATFGAQIEQAAFQYSTVNDIEVYVNGELFDWCDISDAGPSEGNCANSPQLWNYQRFTEN